MADTKIIELTTHTHFPIKLTPHNFPTWRKHVISMLIGLDLDQYVDGPTEPPPKILQDKPNPAYRIWYRQDQILLSALLGSCSETIQPILTSATTSRQAFQRLTETFAGASRSRIISLKARLSKNPQGTRPVAEFLHEMKAITDELALALRPVDDEDLIVHITNQLNDDFKNLAAALKTRDSPISYSELFAQLVDHERWLKETSQTPLISTAQLFWAKIQPWVVSQQRSH
ncbi:hypothetical protein E3N88_26321 [Mikania micrantha]|uniref:Retrotransposon Copia-like N-terminal domain-containing protein n=1 Tax=Mikania micrantha TaxID=192012 RepID=A0A5N6N8A0_9ASTR|nr:hypothetical protein E3N88_26321 [Mikania micrantha]